MSATTQGKTRVSKMTTYPPSQRLQTGLQPLYLDRRGDGLDWGQNDPERGGA